MSVLKKIRENVGLVIVIIALSLFAFIFSSVYDKMGPSGDDTVGEIDGSSISYGELNALYERAQRFNPNAVTTAEQYQLRDQAWQSLVREHNFKKEWKEAGIGISDDELMMLFTGQIQHPLVFQSGYFSDSLGRFDPTAVTRVFQMADEIDLNDPNVQDFWRNWKLGLLDVREIVSQDRRSNKWQAAIKGSALVSDNEVKVAYEQQSRTADISYLFVPYGSINDAQLQISEADRNEYYNLRREAFKRKDEEVNLSYAFFTIAPSSKDSAAARKDLMKLAPEFLKAEKAFEFAASSSDDREQDTVAKPMSMLPPALASINGRTDTVVGPILGGAGLQLLRIVKVQEDSVNANIKIRRILVPIAGMTKEDSTKAKAKADSIATVIAADKNKFAEISLSMTNDPAQGEGQWIVENTFGDAFAAEVKKREPGAVFVSSTNVEAGYIVVDLMERSRKLYAFASISRGVNAGTETNDSIFKKASAFHTDILSGMAFDSAIVKFPEGRALKTGIIGPGTYNLPGVLAGRPVVTWGFKSEEGTICEQLIETEGAFVVAKVDYKGDRGYGSADDLKDNFEFETGLRNWVKAKQIKAKLGAGGGDLQAMASAYGVGATVGAAKGLRFASNDVQGLGAEPKVVGRAFGLQPGTVSKPIAGNSGVFVVKLEAIQEPAPMDEMSKMMQTMSLTNSKADATITALFMGMRDISGVKDMRYKADF